MLIHADPFILAPLRNLLIRYSFLCGSRMPRSVGSDALEQLSVFSRDAFRLSSREFLARYCNMRKNQTHTEKVSNRPLAKLRDLLDE